jgi:hypothetical protein
MNLWLHDLANDKWQRRGRCTAQFDGLASQVRGLTLPGTVPMD